MRGGKSEQYVRIRAFCLRAPVHACTLTASNANRVMRRSQPRSLLLVFSFAPAIVAQTTEPRSTSFRYPPGNATQNGYDGAGGFVDYYFSTSCLIKSVSLMVRFKPEFL